MFMLYEHYLSKPGQDTTETQIGGIKAVDDNSTLNTTINSEEFIFYKYVDGMI